MLLSSARLLQRQRHELEYLRDLIEWRLQLSDQQESEWNQDNPFYWRTLMSRSEVPIDAVEQLSGLYEKGDYDRAEALARLLIDGWSNYAQGYNYLGLIAQEREDLQQAREYLEKAMAVGRKLFPKRIAKATYWRDHATRPYMRAMIYLAETCDRLGEHDLALELCDRLEKECGDDISAAMGRIPIYLNTGAWKEAAQAAWYVHEIYPRQNLPLAFALFELGERGEALVHFLKGTLQFPRAARMLCRQRSRKPRSSSEVRDYNIGVGYLNDLEKYLSARSHKGRRFFAEVLKTPEVAALIDEAEETRRRWSEDRSGDRTWFDKMHQMESMAFARARAAELWPEQCGSSAPRNVGQS